jgi:pimeloyl-ACP methyl ester carboxylesterase
MTSAGTPTGSGEVARVVLVHGINNTFSGPRVMACTWVPALLDGVDLVGGKAELSADDIACVSYGNVFRGPERFLGDADEDNLDADDIEAGDEADLVLEWWRAAANNDSAVVPPDARTLGGAGLLQSALAALAGSKFLASASERALIFWLKQVRAYFRDSYLREQIQFCFADAIQPDTRVVVAHSLGSVVAYEALCAHPEWNIRGLVTLGSPLGIRNIVLDRLVPPPTRVNGTWRGTWPASLITWTNIADQADFVALVKRLAPIYGERVVDVEIDNGAKMHAVERYLIAGATGAAILGGLRDGGSSADGGSADG